MPEKIQTLDYYVKEALRSFMEKGDITFKLPKSKHTLVVGSQSGYFAGRIVYRFAGRAFSHAKEVMAQYEIDKNKKIIKDLTIISASGYRQVIPIAKYALDNKLAVNAILCRKDTELEKKYGKKLNIIRVDAIEEPPTINTATYGGMIRGVTKEDISKIAKAVDSISEPKEDYSKFNSFTVLFPDSMPEVASMIDWKLRGENIGRRIGTASTYLTNFMHGAGVTDAKRELYIALGLNEKEKKVFRNVFKEVPARRKHYVNVPPKFGPLGFLMVGYSVVGQIQKKYKDFQKQIMAYKKKSGKWDWLSPITKSRH
jgi:hypothetical protein